jgi:hypothetical protein
MVATHIRASGNALGIVKTVFDIWTIRIQSSVGIQMKVQRLSKAIKFSLTNVTISDIIE